MPALCSMFLMPINYAQNYAGIIGTFLTSGCDLTSSYVYSNS